MASTINCTGYSASIYSAKFIYRRLSQRQVFLGHFGACHVLPFQYYYVNPTGCATCTTFRHRHFRWGRLIETAEVEQDKVEVGERKSEPLVVLYRRRCMIGSSWFLVNH